MAAVTTNTRTGRTMYKINDDELEEILRDHFGVTDETVEFNTHAGGYPAVTFITQKAK